jgi:hypothetical protein
MKELMRIQPCSTPLAKDNMVDSILWAENEMAEVSRRVLTGALNIKPGFLFSPDHVTVCFMLFSRVSSRFASVIQAVYNLR